MNSKPLLSILGIVIVIVSAIFSTPASARGRFSVSVGAPPLHARAYYPHRFHHHRHFGYYRPPLILYAPPFYYSPPPLAYYPGPPVSYYEPPVTYYSRPTPAENPPPAQEPLRVNFYCPESRLYYPEAKECPSGWLRVLPEPSEPAQGDGSDTEN